MGGPILMAEVTAKVAELGIEPLLRWIAFISANIGFSTCFRSRSWMAVTLCSTPSKRCGGKPLSERLRRWDSRSAWPLLMMLMVFVNFNDLSLVWRRLTGTG